MKKMIPFAVAALLMCFAACKNNGYKIKGTIDGAEDGDIVILAKVHDMFDVDTIQKTVIKNGEFTFEGVQDTAAIRFIIWQSSSNADLSIATQVALENAKITVNMDTQENTVAELGGTPANEALTALKRSEMELNQQGEAVVAVFTDSLSTEEERAEAEKKLNELQQKMVTIYQDFVIQNIGNIAGVTYLIQYASLLDDAVVMDCLQNIPQELENESIQGLRAIYDVKAQTAVGKPFKDIKAATPDGGELSVSQVAQGAKVLMIDFWASWCGPCRAEMPNVKAAYDKFHEQGFNIIGVSLDQDASAWKDAIASLGMTWPQISDLKGWDCEGAGIYGVRSIPTTVLIKDGIVVARDLRGDDLAQKVEELLGN